MSKQLIIDECKREGLPLEQAAYVLATAKWETNHTFEPVREAYWLSEDWRKRNLRYYPWYGRGFVQLTWQDNYRRASRELGVDFLTDPDRVMNPEYAAKVLVRGCKEGWFTGHKLSDHISASKTDYINARRIVNGVDKAQTIAELASEYETELKITGYDKPETKTETKSEPEEVHWLIRFFRRFF